MNILGVGAHPDDLDFSSAGTFAKWVMEGNNCYYLICTDGRKGSDDREISESGLVAARRGEQQEAGRILGLKDIFFLGHHDTELEPSLEIKKEITRYIRMIKPEIVVGLDPAFLYSENLGFINHTDHRAAGLATMDAVYPLSRDRLTFPELEQEGLKPHKVSQLYLVRFESPKVAVDVSETMEIKLKVANAHKTQVSKEAIKLVIKRAEYLGKLFGFKYAEGFTVINIPS